MIKLIDLLNEVGEGTAKPYEWEEISADDWGAYIRFLTDSETEYQVNLEYFTSNLPLTPDLPGIAVEFLAKPKGEYDFSNTVVVNKGEVYRVMSTIVNIIKYYLKDNKIITYSPEKKSGEDFGKQRDNLYKAFMKKSIPSIKFEQKGETIWAIIP